MLSRLKTPWTAGIVLFALATVAIYLLIPLFRISIFGIETGLEYLKLIFRTNNVANITSFLLPLIGGAGAVACALTKNRGPHILTVAFALLPVMFFVYFIVMIHKYTDFSFMGAQVLSLFDVVGAGIWLGLLSAMLALVASVLLVVTDAKKAKQHRI